MEGYHHQDGDDQLSGGGFRAVGDVDHHHLHQDPTLSGVPAPDVIPAGDGSGAPGSHVEHTSSSTYASLFSGAGPEYGDPTEWTPDDDSRLLKLVSDLGKRKWDEVAEQMSIKKPRSTDQCRDRFLCKLVHISDWTEEDDRTLVAAQHRLGDRFDLMAKVLEGRQPMDIRERWLSIVQSKADKIAASCTDEDIQFIDDRINSIIGMIQDDSMGGHLQVHPDASTVDAHSSQGGLKLQREAARPWTLEEDDKLIKLVEELGSGKWTQICKSLPGRTVMQCRQRFLNKLDPSSRKGDWTEEEDLRIVAAQSRLGNRWQEIAKYLDGRSDFSTQRRWLSVLQAKAQRMLEQMTEADFMFLKSSTQLPRRERSPWTPDEDHKLLKLVEQYGLGKWTLVAKHMDCGRTGLQCRQRYLGKLDPTIKEGPWTDEEDRRIVAAQSRLGNRWQEIAKYLDGRSWSAAHARWFSTLQPRAEEYLAMLGHEDFVFLDHPIKDTSAPSYGARNLWSKEEDAELLRLVQEIGQGKWTEIAKRMPGRLPKQCRQRFFNKVDPSLSTSAWTEEEDRKIVAGQDRLGNRFAEVAKHLHGRSESVVSHRWHLVLQWRRDDILQTLTEADYAFLGDTKDMPRRERREWTHEEDLALIKLVEELGQGNWPSIAGHFQDRSAKRCRDRYLNKLDPALTTSAWTEDEDRKIVAAQARLGNRWQEMSKRLDGRSERAVKDRWLSVLQHKADEMMMMMTDVDFEFLQIPICATPGLRARDKEDEMLGGVQNEPSGVPTNMVVVEEEVAGIKSPWTPEEDAMLLKLVEEQGPGKWTQLAKHMPGRLPKQCRARYVGKVDPTLRKDKWSDEEDRRIVAAQSRLGNKFVEISKFLVGRSEKMVSRRWNRVLQRKALQMLEEFTKEDFMFMGEAGEEAHQSNQQRRAVGGIQQSISHHILPPPGSQQHQQMGIAPNGQVLVPALVVPETQPMH